ncbi:flavin reductase family protein [Chelatococcus sp. GCM10030263]|uniref:flavin reductase family protein n=1 Tax=Chelatococcus sp. GCM10030263 TaxID=3273387 RepID=UPI003607B248
MYFYEPSRGHGLPHDPFNAIIGPRPIGWIASRAKDGVLNLAPYSFFNAFNYKPPIIGFSSTGRKDTVRNIGETGQFVWNLATRRLATAMNVTSTTLPASVDEFALAGLTPAACRLVDVPRVAESPVAMECVKVDIIQLKSAAGEPVESWLTLGEVVGVHIDDGLLKDGVYDTAAALPILRAGGVGGYAQISPEVMFEMIRPDALRK